MNGIFPAPFSGKRGDYGSLHSQGLGAAALGRPGSQP
jgi:hypothetical protein